MKKILLILFLISLNFSNAQSWSSKSDIPGLARRNTVGFSLNGYGYICQGGDGGLLTSKHFNDLYQYDQNNDSWSKKDSFPGVPRRGGVAFTIDSFAYVGMGWNNTTTFYDIQKYNPNNNSWDTIADYPGNGGREAFAIGDSNLAYVGGGRIATSSSAYYRDFWEYNPSLNSWTKKTDLPFGDRASGVIFSHQRKIYAGLGHKHTTAYKDLWVYDPSTNTWTQKKDFPGNSRMNPVYFKIDDKLIVGGGTSATGGIRYDDYYEYNPNNDTWDTLGNFPIANYSRGAYFSLSGKGYIATGSDSLGANSKKLLEFNNSVTSVSKVASDSRRIKIYPNPFTEIISLTLRDEAELIIITDMTGRLIQQIRANSIINSTVNIDTKAYKKGLYFLTVQQKESWHTLKIIKQ